MQYFFAPMEGLTDRIYRQTHHAFFPGMDGYYIPFLSPTMHHCLTAREQRELPPAEPGIHAVPQILTKNAADFLWAAEQCRQQGYDEVNLNLGSGNVTIDGVDALSNYFNIGSGAFTYNGTGVACEELYLNMGSGKAVMNNAACGSYSIEIGTGVFEIYGITGSGSFEMGSGSGTLGFSDVINYNSLEIGSGSLKVALPDNTSAEISADIGSGSVHVDACGQNTRLRDGNKITLGGGESENEISVDLASGSVRFTNDKPAATTAQTETAAFDEVSIVDTPAQTTVVTSSLAEIDPEEFIAAVDTLNAAA